MMALFCKACIREHLGLKPNDAAYNSWLVSTGSICEGCGYKYMDGD